MRGAVSHPAPPSREYNEDFFVKEAGAERNRRGITGPRFPGRRFREYYSHSIFVHFQLNEAVIYGIKLTSKKERRHLSCSRLLFTPIAIIFICLLLLAMLLYLNEKFKTINTSDSQREVRMLVLVLFLLTSFLTKLQKIKYIGNKITISSLFLFVCASIYNVLTIGYFRK
jgi:hypothetical protein